MIKRSTWLGLGVVLTLAISSPGLADPPALKEPPVSTELLVAQLGSESYQERQQATRELVTRGAEAVEQMKSALTQGNPEVGNRVLSILGQMIELSQDPKTIDAAEFALQDLVEQEKPGVSERAQTVLVETYPVREERAIAELQRLGGQVKLKDGPSEELIFNNGMLVPSPIDPAESSVEYVIIGSKWKGADEGLKQLKRLTGLRTAFVIKGSGVSEEALRDIKIALPTLQLQMRDRSFLGVQMITMELGCQIARVTPGSAAEKGGLQATDIITAFDGKPVQDSETLIELIGHHDPGQAVKMNLLRRKGDFGSYEPMTLELKLGSWDDALAGNKPTTPKPELPPVKATTPPPSSPEPLPIAP